MIADLKPYPEYKESGIPWTPELPSTWKTERAKRLFTKMQREVRPEDDVVTCFRDGMVTLRKNRRLRGFTEATAFSGYQGIRKGDLVIHGMDAFAGAIGVSDSDGKGTPVYNVCKPGPGIVAGYYAHTLREMSRSQWILALAKGIRERSTDFRYEMFGNQFVPLPPPDEQSAIVRFLDHWNGRLEKAIRSKRRVIALLQEQKQAIIHRAVTRGLDHNVKLKDSGIPWLGEIPEYWEVAKFKHFFRVQMGQTFLKPDLSDAGELPVLSATMSGAILGYTTKAKARTILKVGDLVIPARGNSIGYVALVSQICTSSQTTIQALRIQNDRLLTRFAHLFSVGNKPFLYSFVQTAIPQITTREVATNPLIVPPISEQEEICDAVDRECSGLNTAIARFEREITLLREYRTRLTADVVTGKLDVRAASSQLPEEAEEETLPDAEVSEEETELEEVE
jgi:type I restriction enzyme S subunit